MSDRTQKRKRGSETVSPARLCRSAPRTQKNKEGEDRTRTGNHFGGAAEFVRPSRRRQLRQRRRERQNLNGRRVDQWPPLVSPWPRPRVEQASPRVRHCARKRPPRRFPVPPNGVRAGRAPAQEGRVVGQGRRSKSANRDSAVRSMQAGESEKAKTSPSRSEKCCGVIPPKAAGATRPEPAAKTTANRLSPRRRDSNGEEERTRATRLWDGARRGWTEGSSGF